MTERDERLRAHATARVPIEELRRWPTVQTGIEGAQGRWRSWTDDEQEEGARRRERVASGAVSDDEQREIMLAMLRKQAQVAGRSPAPEELARAVEALVVVSKSLRAGQEPPSDAQQELRAALAVLRGVSDVGEA
jgi:hypothetical protein